MTRKIERTKANSPAPVFDQRYLLQRRNGEGHLIKVETYDKPTSPEEVLRRFGQGYYILKSVKPRFQTVWKKQIGDDDNSEELHRVKKNIKNLTYGFAALSVGGVIGFGLAHSRFCRGEERLDGIEAGLRTLQIFKPESMQCGNCASPLDFLFQRHCGHCGEKIDWARVPPPSQPAEAIFECLRCRMPVLRHQAYCPHCGFQQPIPISSISMSAWKPVTRSAQGR